MTKIIIAPRRAAAALATLSAIGFAGGCMSKSEVKKEKMATASADIRGFLPNTISGTAGFTDAGKEGLRIKVDVDGLLPNREYAIHIHENGNCSDPDSTGPHFDPGHSGHHGSPGGSPGAHHAGDLPNLSTDEHGHGHLEYATDALGIRTSGFSVAGRSIVIHADKDDFTTQPAGNSGVKIACGPIHMPG